MCRTKLLLISLLLFSYTGAEAQSASKIKQASYQAYTGAKIALWDKAINLAEDYYSTSGSKTDLHGLLISQYGYIAFSIAENYTDKGKDMLVSAYKNLKVLKDLCGENAEIIALEASFVAYELNFYKFKMMRLGPKAVELTNRAYELDPNNLMALACKANQLNFTPKIFGGSPPDAIPLFKKIIKLYETHCEDPSNNYRYISTLVTLAAIYEEMLMYSEACALYEQIIDFDSNINWINTDLYPACKSKLSIQQSGN
ncbi:MAG: hypothetical protein QNK33_00145 [Bacteroidales bacterium]|nr:hypothetical protein [Bacteroidales bacterium]